MSGYTPSLGLELITPGSQAGLWGNTTNNSLNLIDQAITGVTIIPDFAGVSGVTKVLTDYNGAENQARAAVLNITGIATGPNTVVLPNKQKTYLVRNDTAQTVRFQTAVPGDYYDVEAGNSILIFCDGDNNVYTGIKAPGVGTLTVSGGGTGTTTFGSGGFVKSAGGTSALTAATTVDASTEVSGVLPVGNGGTGLVNPTAGAVLLGNGSGSLAALTGGANNNVLTWSTAYNSWISQAPSSGGITSISAGTGITVNGGTGPVTSGSVTIASTGSMVYPGLGIPSSSGSSWGSSYNAANPIPISYGGTGANSAAGALSALGAPSLSATQTWTGANTFSTNTTTFSKNPLIAGDPVGTNAVGLSNTNTYIGANSSGSQIVITNNSVTSATFSQHRVDIAVVTDGVPALAIAGNGKTSHVSNTSIQLGYNGQGIGSSASGSIQMFAYNGAVLSCAGPDFIADVPYGNAYKQGGGSWAVYSDARLKENVAPLSGALDKINALNPVTYSWKYETNEPTVGFIAQEVDIVLPNAVNTIPATDEQKPFVDDDEVYSIGWQNDMFAYMVGAIKELKAELDSAKARIAELEAK